MSQALRGTDLVIETRREGFDTRGVLDAVSGRWPDAWFQNADEEGTRPLVDVLADPGVPVNDEFFVYRDAASAASWRDNGWTESHGNDMLHVLVESPPGWPDFVRLTVVIDALTGDVLGLVDDVYEAVCEMASGRPPIWGTDWTAELKTAGLEVDRRDFLPAVLSIADRLLPPHVRGEPACYPRAALDFCEAVRTELGAAVPDHLIMKALLALKKFRRGDGQVFRPRLSWTRG